MASKSDTTKTPENKTETGVKKKSRKGYFNQFGNPGAQKSWNKGSGYNRSAIKSPHARRRG